MADREDAQARADGDPSAEEPHAPVPAREPRVVVPVAEPHVGGAAVAAAAVHPVGEDDAATTAEDGPSRGGCRTDRQGWAGAHLHGAVRPRRRAAGRGRPPGRWC